MRGDMISPPKKVQEAIISRVKIMGRMDIAERRLPQDGGTTIKVGESEVDLRISSIPTSEGERIVMRLLDRSGRRYLMEEIGFDEHELDKFKKLIVASHGIILVTGPTGSGKTTTLYAALSTIDAKEKNVTGAHLQRRPEYPVQTITRKRRGPGHLLPEGAHPVST